MKKIYTLSAALLLTGSLAFAEIVEQDRAQSIAARWLGSDAVLTWEVPRTKADAEPLLYVFNRPEGGWVMISADDVLCPILAYSDEGEFRSEGMPVQLKSWIDSYVKSTKEVRLRKLQASSETRQMWQTAGYRTKASGGKLLETAKWGQDSPYNLLCPQVKESGRQVRAVTGCVATAMSIVCRYHQWPEKGKGTIGGYNYKSDADQNVSIPSYSIDDHVYDYSLMPLKYSSSANTSQKNAVAQLMHDNGVMVEAEYNYYYGTGALSQNICNALFKHMSYSGEARLEYRNMYNDVEWIRMIKNEIDNDRPILYGGYDPDNGGHQFVCDGYDSNDKIHINWGWEGSSDGYFTLKLSIPGDCTFNELQDMVIGLEPDRNGTTTTSGGPLSFINNGYSNNGLELVSGTISSKTFSVKAGNLCNQDSYNKYEGSIRVALLDKDGTLKETVSNEQRISISPKSLTTVSKISCTIKTSSLEFGDVVVLQFKDRNGEWKKVRADTDYGEVFCTLPYIDAPFIKLAASYNAGDRLYFELSETGKCIKTISWSYDGSTQSGVCMDLNAGTHTISASISYTDGSSETITATIEVQ